MPDRPPGPWRPLAAAAFSVFMTLSVATTTLAVLSHFAGRELPYIELTARGGLLLALGTLVFAARPSDRQSRRLANHALALAVLAGAHIFLVIS